MGLVKPRCWSIMSWWYHNIGLTQIRNIATPTVQLRHNSGKRGFGVGTATPTPEITIVIFKYLEIQLLHESSKFCKTVDSGNSNSWIRVNPTEIMRLQLSLFVKQPFQPRKLEQSGGNWSANASKRKATRNYRVAKHVTNNNWLSKRASEAKIRRSALLPNPNSLERDTPALGCKKSTMTLFIRD